MRTYWVYILASRPYGTLYIGVTNNLLGRVERHKDGDGSAFTSQFGVGRLVHFEAFAAIDDAIRREKSLKRYRRQWKVHLIESDNSHWQDCTLRCEPYRKTARVTPRPRNGSSGQARG